MLRNSLSTWPVLYKRSRVLALSPLLFPLVPTLVLLLPFFCCRDLLIRRKRLRKVLHPQKRKEKLFSLQYISTVHDHFF